MLRDFEYCDFDTIKEDWNRYKIQDGTELKIKFVLIKVVRKKIPGTTDGYNYGFNNNVVVGVHSPKKHEPSERIYSVTELKDSIIESDMEYTTIKEVWNKYVLKKDKTELKVKLAITDIKKTDKYNEYGDPHFFISTQPIIKANPSNKTIGKKSK